jgi:prophage antirepressor-like protein
MDKGEIVLFRPQDERVAIDVLVENETVWLTLDQMAELFERDKSTISRHIKNAFGDGELVRQSVVADFATTATDNKTYQVSYFNLDVIISVGYRVKSQRGVQFRHWATQVLKDYILRGYAISQRFERLEHRMAETEKKIDFFVKTSLPPKEGVFFDGQIFDAYAFASDMVKAAKKQIVLLDNYIDETILLLLAKREVAVSAEIYTRSISKQLQLDLIKHNAQYPPITIHILKTFHDRFMIIDGTVYHIGASLKDLGKKLFAFSKMKISAAELLKNV